MKERIKRLCSDYFYCTELPIPDIFYWTELPWPIETGYLGILESEEGCELPYAFTTDNILFGIYTVLPLFIPLLF